MSGPYGNDPYGAPREPGRGQNPPEPTRRFPQPQGPQSQGYVAPSDPYPQPSGSPYPQGGYPPPPPGYGPPPPGPGGPGGPKRNLGPWLGVAGAVVVLVVLGLVLFFTVGRHSDQPVAATTSTPASTTTARPSTTASAKATAVPPLPSSLVTRAPTTTSPPPTTTAAAPTSAAAGRPATADEAQQITALSKALVDGISRGDVPALAKITCGTLASKLDSGASQPDPTVYDHVDNITVSPDGSSGSVDVYAYTVKSGPPAQSVTFTVQKQGPAWKACDVKQ